MDKEKFVKGVERLINPIDVGSLHFIQGFNSLLPKFIQEKLVKSSAKQTPYMGFVVEPYSVFLFCEIKDIDRAKQLLPKGFELIKSKVFENDEPKYYCIFGCFTAHTSAFWGSRIEFYIVAEDKSTGLLSWIIVDYDSNTISYDKKNGLHSPNSSKGVVTTDYSGTVFVDFKRDDDSRGLQFNTDVKNGNRLSLDKRLWLEGNLSIGYSSEFDKESADIFSLKFDPKEVDSALDIPLKDLDIKLNTWYPGLFEGIPSRVVCFPYAQHFLSDSPGSSSKVLNESELLDSVNGLDFNRIKVFSTKSFKTMFMIGSLVSLLTTLILITLLILK